MKRLLGLALVAVTASLPLSAEAQLSIGAPGGSEVRPFGKPNAQTFGQTITVGSTNVLTDFSFWFGRGFTDTYDLGFRAYVYSWDPLGHGAVGPSLFTSALMNVSGSRASLNVQRTFLTGALALNPGSMYVLFVSTSGLAGNGSIFFSDVDDPSAYTGGQMVFYNNGEDFDALTSSRWDEWENSADVNDLQFEANFVSVLEPSTWLLLCTGLLGLSFVARRRREQSPVMGQVRAHGLVQGDVQGDQHRPTSV